MSFFDNNMAALSKAHPAAADAVSACTDDGTVAVVQGKNGPIPEVTAAGRTVALHSRFDPEKEATRFAGEIDAGSFDLFVVAGFGFAYHIEELLKRAGRDAMVLVMEKSPLMVRRALESRDLSSLFGDPRFHLIIGPREEDIATLLQGKSTRRTTFLTHRGSHQADPAFCANVVRIAKSYLSTKEVNIATLAKFEKVWSINIARNIGAVADLPAARRFYGAFKGYPAIVASAGPSLSRSIGFIKKHAERALIIAVDTSYGLLRRHGIEPQFCVTVDPQAINARYFEGDIPGRTVLVADPSSHPSVFRLFRGRTTMTGTAFPMMKWVEEICGERGEIAHGGSVSTNAYDFAKRLGASPVIVTGQDLAFTGGYAHARGSYLDELVHLRSSRFSTPEMFNRFQLTALPPIFVRGIRGGTVHTNQKMMIFLKWFEDRKDPDMVNATFDGAFMKGVRQVGQDEMLLSVTGDGLRGLIDGLWEEGLRGRDRRNIRAMLQEKCFEMRADLGGLIPVLKRAVALSEDLMEQAASQPRDGAKISYIIKKLDEADRAIHARTGLKDMIGLAIQRVIHTITEGHETEEGEEVLSEDARVARRSLYLYRGLLEGAEFSARVLWKMIGVLQNTAADESGNDYV